MDNVVNSDTYTYKIDNFDKVVSLSENWLSFAVDNGAVERNNPDEVIGVSLWDFISGDETKHLYQIVLKEVRRRKRSIKLLFRCDSPDTCRHLQLTVIPLEGDHVEFQSQILRTETRNPVDILNIDAERSDKLIRICSVCKRIAVSDTLWEETEIAINTLKIFEKKQVPQLTHGLCKSCFDEAMIEVRSMKSSHTINEA